MSDPHDLTMIIPDTRELLAEVSRLRTELARVQQERDELKSAASPQGARCHDAGECATTCHDLDRAEAQLTALRQEHQQVLHEYEAELKGRLSAEADLTALQATVQRLRDALTKAHEFIANVDLQGDWWRRQQAALCDELDVALHATGRFREEAEP